MSSTRRMTRTMSRGVRTPVVALRVLGCALVVVGFEFLLLLYFLW